MKKNIQRSYHPPYKNKGTLTIFIVLRILVVCVLIRSLFIHEYENVYICILTSILLLLPSIISRHIQVKLPSALERAILIFIFAAEILGEIDSFYVNVPHWDTILHTVNGFNCAAIGFSLVDLLNRDQRFPIKLSPLFLAVVAFCFSMTVGIIWEFIEYSGDLILGCDAQKDTVINSIRSITLDETRTNKTVLIDDITDVLIVHSDGVTEPLGIGGYLDIGLNDTMKDLFVNFIGASIFSYLGYKSIGRKNKEQFISRFIPQVLHEENHENNHDFVNNVQYS